MEYSIYNNAMETWHVAIQHNVPAHQAQLVPQHLATHNIRA